MDSLVKMRGLKLESCLEDEARNNGSLELDGGLECRHMSWEFVIFYGQHPLSHLLVRTSQFYLGKPLLPKPSIYGLGGTDLAADLERGM